MTKDEIKFFKHCLQNYNYYWKHYLELQDIREELSAERLALATKTSSVLKKPDKSKEPFDLYSSAEWKTLVKTQEDCEREINFFWQAIWYTDQLVNDVSDYRVKTMLKELYFSGVSRKEVRDRHFFADDKAMYRAIRIRLEKHRLRRPMTV